ncbi:hypothetical protein M432DRAFT_540105 [Thermoascus aurantiacus ATCC 26904]
MPSSHNLQCSLCFASFRRLEHLQRHLTSHTDGRPYSCIFCSKSFKRSDVLKRHWRTCRARIEGGRSIPQASSTVKRRRRQVCDNCARLKRACSLGSPCEACASRQQDCSYSEQISAEMPSTGVPGSDVQLDLTRNSTMAPRSIFDNPTVCLPQSFSEIAFDIPLELGINCGETALYDPSRVPEEASTTDDLRTFTSSGFVYHSMHRLPTAFGDTGGDWHHESNQSIQTMSESLPGMILGGFNSGLTSTDSPSALEFVVFPWANCILDPLTIITNEIVCRLKETISHRPKDSCITIEWSPVTEDLCTKFFSPLNIRKFIHLFWCLWYPNCPIIHKPTFCIQNTPLPLLITMLLIGACLSGDEVDTRHVHMWFDSVEELVFSEERLQEAVTGSSQRRNYSRYESLQALQAAYLVCIYQNWEGSDRSRQRIRRVRYSMVVAAARDLDLGSATHSKLDLTNFNWREFVRDEELIRTLLYVFLLDTAFAIFNNLPPRLAITELKMNMACPEPCFQAQSADECLLQLRMASTLSDVNSIGSAVETICEKEMSTESRRALSQIGTLNLFVIISALHVLIFHAKTSFTFKQSISPIKQGLRNWKRLWDEHQRSHAVTSMNAFSFPDMWKRDGFMKHAADYWALANLIIERTQSTHSSRPGIVNSDEGVSEKYDDTDIRQVTDLIKGFREMGLVGNSLNAALGVD